MNELETQLIDERKVYQEIIQEIVTGASDDYSVLSKLLKLAISVVPEADYGSVSVIEEDSWRFIDAVGHDADRLKELTLKFTKYDKEMGSGIFVVDNLLEHQQDIKTGQDLENYKELVKASKPIKSTIEVIARNEMQFLGQLTLDIKADSEKAFTKESVDKLQLYRDTLKLALLHKENSTIIDRYDNVIEIFNQHTNQFNFLKKEFIDDFSSILLQEVHEASCLLFSTFEDNNAKIEKVIGFSELEVNNLPSSRSEFLELLDSDSYLEVSDNVYLYRSETSEVPIFVNSEVDLEKRDSLLALLKSNDQFIGYIYMRVGQKNYSSFSRKSKKVFSLMSKLASTFIVLYRNNKVIDNFELISGLINKLMFSVINQDELFLAEVLNTAVEMIPEASYGSISEFEDGLWKYKYGVGHDVKKINKIGLKESHCVKVESITDVKNLKDSKITIIKDFDKYRNEEIPVAMKEKFLKAAKPIGQSAFMQYHLDGVHIGNFSIDTARDNIVDFSESSISLLKAFSNIVFVYFGFRNFISEQEKSQEEIRSLNHMLEERVKKRTEELNQANIQLQELVSIDGLTELYNRRSFDDYINEKWKSASRHKENLAIIMIDIDNFKAYNDYYGHMKGDRCLQQFASILTNHFKRGDDYVARYGGEEFVVAISKTDDDQVIAYVESLLEEVRKEMIPHLAADKKFLTISAGIAFKNESDKKLTSCLKRSDEALYFAKANGKDQVGIK